MALPPPPLPDPVALRDALRGLRHALRSGHATLSGTVALDQLPPEAATLTRGAVATGERLARGVENLATDVLRQLLGGTSLPPVRLADLAARGPAGADDFAGFCYVGLTMILQRLGVEDALISEGAARRAWQQVLAAQPAGTDPVTLAARLLPALRQQRVLRDITAGPTTGLDTAEIVPVAQFALLLWLLDDSGTTGPESLESSRALHRARLIAADILRADSVDNTARLAELLDQNVTRHGLG